MCATPGKSSAKSSTAVENLTQERRELLDFLNDPKMPVASKAEAIAALFNLLQIARGSRQDFGSPDPDDMS